MIIYTLMKKNFIKKIFNFIYNLRYLLFIFIFSIILLFTAPKLFKFVNKIDELNNILKNQHGFTIKNSNEIKYKIFPLPNLEIKYPTIIFEKKFSNIKVEELKVFLNFKSLYISDELFLKKIKFKGNYLGNDISGFYKPQKNENLLYLNVKKLGIESNIILNNKKIPPQISGLMKLKVLNDNLLINFDYDQNLKLKKSLYKNKNFQTYFKGQVNFKPFFYFNIFADIKKINFNNLNMKKKYELIINEISNKKINGELHLNYLTKNIIHKKNLEANKINFIFKNGDIISKNSFFKFADLNIKANFYLKTYPLYKDLDYELLIDTQDINKFFKLVGIKKSRNMKETNVLVKGKVNLDAQKYYFNKILINKKIIEEKKLTELKDYFDKNAKDFFYNDLTEKKIYLFLKNLIESI